MLDFKINIKFVFKLTIGFCLPLAVLAHSVENFEEAKTKARVIWGEHRETFYCGCAYDKQGLIDYKHCSFVPQDKRKSKRIQWEHVVAASWYGKQLDCWNKPICVSSKGKKYKGRNCCRQIDPTFRQMEADLHNLVPVIPEINMARSNYHFTEFDLGVHRNKHYYKGCPMIIDERYHLVETQDLLKGMIARIHFYMENQYGIVFSQHEKQLLSKWDKQYPASDWEKRWNQKVAAVQGNENPFIH